MQVTYKEGNEASKAIVRKTTLKSGRKSYLMEPFQTGKLSRNYDFWVL